MKALILVDLQNDFAPGGALPVPEGDHVVPVANRILETFDIVVATQDWHPPEHSSFAAHHPGKAPGDVIELEGVQQILWPAHCVRETRGADFLPHLDRTRLDGVFRKGTDAGIDSYSGFFDNSRRKATGLEEYLKSRRVTQVYVLGLATDYCVKSTALDATTLGFTTFVVRDGCRGVELQPGDVSRALDEMREAGVTLVDSTAIPGCG